MLNVIKSKLKEVFFSVLPIVLIVLALHLTLIPLSLTLWVRFLVGAVLVIIGLAVFLLGVELGITPLGHLIGITLAKTNKLPIVLVGGVILGFFISVAEPGLMVLASEVALVTGGKISSTVILLSVSVGLALMLALGFLRIFYNYPLYKVLFVLYGIVFVLSIFTSNEFLAMSFDASGATTGILAVPFILALSFGISKLKKDSKASEKDSFGLVAIASVGAILAVLFLNFTSKITEFSADLDLTISNDGLGVVLWQNFPSNLKDTLISVTPLLLIFLILQKFSFKLKKKERHKLFSGFVYTYVGMLFFLMGINAGFMDLGRTLGQRLVLMDNKIYFLISAFALGFVTIMAEPAVYVLTYQIEDVTSGYVKRKAVLWPLALGVGIAVALSALRVVVPELQLWHYLLPGYAIALGLMFFVPKLFVGIAFDAGGVATGPMTATFILAFIQGAAHAFEGADLLSDGFGMISMVAMMPIITLQILGLVFSLKLNQKKKEEVQAK